MKAKWFPLRALALAAVLALTLSLTALAADFPEPDRTGSLRLTLKSGETALTGGSLSLYRVGEIALNDGDWSYEITEEFRPAGLELNEPADGKLAGDLARYARDNGLKGRTLEPDGEGKVCFEDLQTGLYLLVQKKSCEGYYPLKPFLVSLPCQVDGAWVYEVDAAPKTQLRPRPEEITPAPPKPDGPALPQTGQLNWPVPFLALGGLSLFGLGWRLWFGGRSREK